MVPQIEIGTLVRYWRGDRAGDPTGQARTRTKVHALSTGAYVLWLHGVPGCISITHVEPVLEMQAGKASSDRPLKIV